MHHMHTIQIIHIPYIIHIQIIHISYYIPHIIHYIHHTHVGSDGSIRLWNYSEKQVLKKVIMAHTKPVQKIVVVHVSVPRVSPTTIICSSYSVNISVMTR